MNDPSHIPRSGRPESSSGRRLPCIHSGVILLLGIVCYVNSFSVPLQFDDPAVVRLSTTGIDLYSLQCFLARTRWFTDITFALNRSLHGERLFGYHLVNLAVHLSAAGVLYLLVLRAIDALKSSFGLSRDPDRILFLQRFMPLTAAALFVCHPVQTQAVTYIAQRYTSLAALLYFGSLLSYLLARLPSEAGGGKARTVLLGTVCGVCAVLAMKSKEIAFTLPFMMLVLEFALVRGRLLKKRAVMAIVGVMLLAVPLQMVYTHGTKFQEDLLYNLKLATVETSLISRTDYLLTQFRVVATYLRLLVLPINQNLDYDYPVFHTLLEPTVAAALLLHLTLLGTALFLAVRSRRQLISGDPAAGIVMRMVSFGIFWFYLALSVESSLIPIRDVIYEHRMYLPSAGFFMAAAACLAGIAMLRPRYRTVVQAAVAGICLVLAAGTIARNRKWASEMIMWEDVLEKSPNKARPRMAVGFFYFRSFMPEKALPHFVRALELDFSQDSYWVNLNSALWMIDRYKGRCSDGMQYHLAVDRVNPVYRREWLANSFNSLGLAYEILGNLYLAQKNYLKSVDMNPAAELGWYNLALVSARQNDPATVSLALDRLKTINPRLEKTAEMTINGIPAAGKK